jgi:hypothetical protein
LPISERRWHSIQFFSQQEMPCCALARRHDRTVTASGQLSCVFV